jgi:acyl dehydratase
VNGGRTIDVGGPWFEDLTPGLEFDAPAVTLTSGHATAFQALSGDRLRMPLDHELARQVTGVPAPLAHPLVAFNIAIGQTTWASQRVRANLGYRGMRLHRPVFIGDTLFTTTRVVAARQNGVREGRAATGVIALESTTINQHGDVVLHGWRFPMIPCRDPQAVTGRDDDVDAVGLDSDPETIARDLPAWDLAAFRPTCRPDLSQVRVGDTLRIDARDTITGAPEWVRLTLNVAAAHVDCSVTSSARRLVYGGHVIALAFAQATRALPDLVTLLSWDRCDHVSPVFEEDRLRTALDVLEDRVVSPGRLLRLRAQTYAAGHPASGERLVLVWTFYVWSS